MIQGQLHAQTLYRALIPWISSPCNERFVNLSIRYWRIHNRTLNSWAMAEAKKILYRTHNTVAVQGAFCTAVEGAIIYVSFKESNAPCTAPTARNGTSHLLAQKHELGFHQDLHGHQKVSHLHDSDFQNWFWYQRLRSPLFLRTWTECLQPMFETL